MKHNKNTKLELSNQRTRIGSGLTIKASLLLAFALLLGIAPAAARLHPAPAPPAAATTTATPAPSPTPNKKFIIRGGKGETAALPPTGVGGKTAAASPKGTGAGQGAKNITRSAAVLMPGIATRFKCPEPPLQVVLGNQNGIEVVEGVGETNDFFLLPSVAGVTTNMFVQFSSGTSEIKLSVAGGKAKNAAYDSEVNLSVASNELLAKKNQELERRAVALQNELAGEKEKSLQAEAEFKAKIEELEAQSPPLDAAQMARRLRAFRPNEVTGSDYKMTIFSPALPNGKNRYSMLVEITNKDKKKPFVFREVTIEGGAAQIVNGFPELKPGETREVEIVLETAEPSGGMRLKLSGEKTAQLVPVNFAQ